MAFFLLLAIIPVAGATNQGANCDPDNGGIVLPDGFCATVFADGLTRARHIAITQDGAVYVAINNARDGSAVGGVVGSVTLTTTAMPTKRSASATTVAMEWPFMVATSTSRWTPKSFGIR
ncbi:MAG: hypothetical protein ACR2NT_04710 [Acidimicrobiia bacterium]|nr:hypothetical protein [Actinomycetota bacterium]